VRIVALSRNECPSPFLLFPPLLKIVVKGRDYLLSPLSSYHRNGTDRFLSITPPSPGVEALDCFFFPFLPFSFIAAKPDSTLLFFFKARRLRKKFDDTSSSSFPFFPSSFPAYEAVICKVRWSITSLHLFPLLPPLFRRPEKEDADSFFFLFFRSRVTSPGEEGYEHFPLFLPP